MPPKRTDPNHPRVQWPRNGNPATLTHAEKTAKKMFVWGGWIVWRPIQNDPKCMGGTQKMYGPSLLKPGSPIKARSNSRGTPGSKAGAHTKFPKMYGGPYIFCMGPYKKKCMALAFEARLLDQSQVE